MPLIDGRGTPLDVNRRVAFNYSGKIAVGRIISMKDGTPNQWGGYLYSDRPIIKIARETHLSAQAKALSTVRDPSSVLVLFEEE